MADLDPTVQRLALEQIRNLRDFRKTYDLCRALDNPDSSMSNLAKIIVTDPILSGKILKIANSAYFGLQQKVNSIGQALMIIGLTNLDLSYRTLFPKRKLLDLILDSSLFSEIKKAKAMMGSS